MKIDWQSIVIGINRSGLSLTEIGERIGCSQTQVRAYKDIPDTEPRFPVAMALLELWHERCISDRVERAPKLE